MKPKPGIVNNNKMIPREYQTRAISAIWDALQVERHVLLEAACSAGKTFIFSHITQKLLTLKPDYRVLILMDREILVSQTRDKLRQVAPELMLDIGIVCASVSSVKDHEKRVTIASRQSLINRMNQFKPVQLCIVDEAHLMGVPKDHHDESDADQYTQIISTLKNYNPDMRLLGVTATPYRLNDGYIYGDKNAPGCLPYFAEVHHKISVAELIGLGYLAPLRGLTAIYDDTIKSGLENIPLVGGEYNLGAISNLMSEGRHISSAVNAWKAHASDRKKTLAFCVSIIHAEKLADEFNAAGIPAIAIHSELADIENYIRMQSLNSGGHKVFCSVAKLTTGMDVPDIDCIIMARPTKSAALYKQILGRGQRIAPGKTDCLVLDMVGNNSEFGTDLDRLRVNYKRKTVDGKPVMKACPQCAKELHAAVRVCPDCGYAFERPDAGEAGDPTLAEVNYGAAPPVMMNVTNMFISVHESKKTKKELLKVRLEIEQRVTETAAIRKTGFVWVCFEGDGYSGFAVKKGAGIWDTLSGNANLPIADRIKPANAREAESLKHLLTMPELVKVDINGKFPDILEIIMGEKEEVPF